jgi:hypothetical protein
MLLAGLFVPSVSVGARAQEPEDRTSRITRISKLSATTTGDRGTFSVSSVDTLNRNQFSIGLGWDNFDRTPRDLDVNVGTVFVSYGVTGRITVTAGIEAIKQVTARNLPQTGFYNSLPFVTSRFSSGIGDASFRVKYRVQRRADNVGGISLSTFLKAPNTDAARGLGTGQFDAGLELGFTSLLPLNFLLHSTTAIVATADTDEPAIRGLQDELRSGIGVAWPASGIRLPGNSALQGIFEYSNTTFIGAGSPNGAIQAPTDLLGGVRYLMLDQGLAFSAGYRRNRNFDTSFPGNTAYDGLVFGLTFTQPVAQPSQNRFPVVLLDAPSETVAPGAMLEVAARAFDADGEDLTYAWNSSGGTIAGTGSTIQFSSATAGTYVIRVVVSDVRGGSAQAELTIRVQ